MGRPWGDVLPLLPLLLAGCASAGGRAPRSFYISPSGRDGGAGSETDPWQTTAPLAAGGASSGGFAAVPGDAVLFEAVVHGSRCCGLRVTRGGSAARPLTIGTYEPPSVPSSSVARPGDRRRLQAAAPAQGLGSPATLPSSALLLDSASHVAVCGLALLGPAADGEASSTNGLTLSCAGAGTRCAGVSLTDVSSSGWGIGVNIVGQDGAGFDGLALLRVYAHDNVRAGISSSGPFPRQKHVYAHRKMVLSNCTASRNLGDATDTKSHTGSGIVLSNVDDATMTWCSAHSNGWLQASGGGGPVGLWAWEARAVVISHSSAWNNSNGVGLHDGGGFDLDGGVTDSVIEYCASWGNTGSGVMLCQFTGASTLSNNTVRNCLSVGDGYDAINSGGLELYSPDTTQPATFIGNTVFAASVTARARQRKVSPPSAVHFMRSNLGTVFDEEVQVRQNVLLQAHKAQGPLIFVGNFEKSTMAPTFDGNIYGSPADESVEAVRWGLKNFSSVRSWQVEMQEDKQAVAMPVDRLGLAPDSVFFADCAPAMDVLRGYDWGSQGDPLGRMFKPGDGLPNSAQANSARGFDGRCFPPLATDDSSATRMKTDDNKSLETALTLSKALSSSMVLQREPAQARLWGVGTAGSTITAAGVTATVGADDRWSILLAPQPAGPAFDTGTIIVKGSRGDTVTLTDVLFGETWLCTGQSNSMSPNEPHHNNSLQGSLH